MMFGNGSGYGRWTRPNEAQAAKDTTLFADLAPPEDVQIQMNIHQVNYVHDVTQSYKVFVMQSAVWMDQRLNQLRLFRSGPQPPQLCMTKQFVNIKYNALKGKLWMPDVYVVNSANDQFLKGGCFLYLHGLVVCSTYHSYVLTCSMDFKKMPFDEQHCHIEMRVSAGTAKVVKLRPTVLAKPLELPKKRVGTIEWNISHAEVETDILTTDAGTEESRVFFKLSLRRESGFYVKEVLVPTVGIMLICWLSFFVTISAVPARCAVTLIAFLTLTNQINGITAKLPRLATDVWLLSFLSGSRWFAFMTILEYGLVNTLSRYEDYLNKAKAAAEKKDKEAEDELKQLEAEHSASADRPPPLKRHASSRIIKQGMAGSWHGDCLQWLLTTKASHMRVKDIDVDVFARWAYPITYVIFFLIMIGQV